MKYLYAIALALIAGCRTPEHLQQWSPPADSMQFEEKRPASHWQDLRRTLREILEDTAGSPGRHYHYHYHQETDSAHEAERRVEWLFLPDSGQRVASHGTICFTVPRKPCDTTRAIIP